jgi:hypothetical protein
MYYAKPCITRTRILMPNMEYIRDILDSTMNLSQISTHNNVVSMYNATDFFLNCA